MLNERKRRKQKIVRLSANLWNYARILVVQTSSSWSWIEQHYHAVNNPPIFMSTIKVVDKWNITSTAQSKWQSWYYNISARLVDCERRHKEHLTLAVVSFYKERIKLVLQLCFLPQVLSTHGKSYQHTEPPTALKRGAHYRQNKPNIKK